MMLQNKLQKAVGRWGLIAHWWLPNLQQYTAAAEWKFILLSLYFKAQI